MLKTIIKNIIRKTYTFYSPKYWEKRYANGGNSGDGSYGKLSAFKADFLNEFIFNHNIQTVAELGCGDGNQLSLINYKRYFGYDVSKTIITHCKKRFKNDETKQFYLYSPRTFNKINDFSVELGLSLDVIYHLIEDQIYNQYLDDLFSLSMKYVIIYSTDFDLYEAQHVRHRNFTAHIREKFGNWKMIDHVVNRYPGNGEQESLADFFVFERQ